MADAPHIMIAESRYYPDLSDELVTGTLEVLEEAGATYERFAVPGAFELPAAIQMAMRSMDFFSGRRRFDGYIVLGTVIRGQTSHYDHICNETARALMDLSCRYTLALGNGIITVENRDQAEERAFRNRLNKGGDAARACLEMIAVKRKFRLFPR